jgi:hypothetical protein
MNEIRFQISAPRTKEEYIALLDEAQLAADLVLEDIARIGADLRKNASAAVPA